MAGAAAYMFLGLICGYLTITLCESFFHRAIQHASPDLRRWYRRLGRLGRVLQDAWYSHHVIHHFQTFRRDHVTQFADDSERARLTRRLREIDKSEIVACEYGNIIGIELKAYLFYMGPTLPVFAATCWLGGLWFTIGACVPLIAWPMLAQFVHPHLHRNHREVMDDPRAWPRFMARTRYFRHLAQHHWLHHTYPNCNYNLLLGGDWLLGVHRRADADDLVAMQSIGLWVRSGD
jgi:hypothetical protein